MKIVDVITSSGLTGFFSDDQKAIKEGAEKDGFIYKGETKTPGYASIRQPGESVSVMLVLENGQIAYGDCATVQYSGVGGRHPVFKADELAQVILGEWADWLRGKPLESFRLLVDEMESLPFQQNGPKAIPYGVSQALLDAVARAHNLTMAEVLSQEYRTELATRPVPIFAQSGDDRYTNADKMISKQVSVLPHGLVNNTETKVGKDGEIFLDYVRWVAKRIQDLGVPGYRPILHFDTYGTLGQIFDDDMNRIADYLGKVEEAAEPFDIQIEGPIDAGSREGQIDSLRELRKIIKQKDIQVKIVADEWCNTLEDIREFVNAEAADFVQIKTPSLGSISNSIEAIQFAKQKGSYTYLGGTCNETERSGQVCAHIALALQPDQTLAKPGMGVDEGLMIVHNEMQRTLAIIRHRKNKLRED